MSRNSRVAGQWKSSRRTRGHRVADFRRAGGPRELTSRPERRPMLRSQHSSWRSTRQSTRVVELAEDFGPLRVEAGHPSRAPVAVAEFG